MVFNDPENAVRKITDARTVLSSTSKLRRTEPDYKQALELYMDLYPELDVSLISMDVDLEARGIHGYVWNF